MCIYVCVHVCAVMHVCSDVCVDDMCVCVRVCVISIEGRCVCTQLLSLFTCRDLRISCTGSTSCYVESLQVQR